MAIHYQIWSHPWWSLPSEWRTSSGLPLLPVYPHVTDEANSCTKLSVTRMAIRRAVELNWWKPIASKISCPIHAKINTSMYSWWQRLDSEVFHLTNRPLFYQLDQQSHCGIWYKNACTMITESMPQTIFSSSFPLPFCPPFFSLFFVPALRSLKLLCPPIPLPLFSQFLSSPIFPFISFHPLPFSFSTTIFLSALPSPHFAWPQVPIPPHFLPTFLLPPLPFPFSFRVSDGNR